MENQLILNKSLDLIQMSLIEPGQITKSITRTKDNKTLQKSSEILRNLMKSRVQLLTKNPEFKKTESGEMNIANRIIGTITLSKDNSVLNLNLMIEVIEVIEDMGLGLVEVEVPVAGAASKIKDMILMRISEVIMAIIEVVVAIKRYLIIEMRL